MLRRARLGSFSCTALHRRFSSRFFSLPASPLRQLPREGQDQRNLLQSRIRSKENQQTGRNRAGELWLPTRMFCLSARGSASAALEPTPANTRSSTVGEKSKGR